MKTTSQPDSQAVLYLNTFERVTGAKALTVPEILSTILDYATRPTLASAACVSRAWSPIALDKLWSNHDVEIVDLLRILPLTSREQYLLGVITREWILERSPTDDEWARFYSYASRVRSLSVSKYQGLEPRVTEWKVEKDVLFPRLRRIEWYSSPYSLLKISRMRSFVTSGLRELYLMRDEGLSPTEEEQTVVPFLNDLARIEGLRLDKLKFEYPVGSSSSLLPVALTILVAAKKDSISVLELPHSNLEISVLANHSLQNLKALTIQPKSVQREGLPDQIQLLVEVCPHVVYLRLWLERADGSVNRPDFSDVRKFFAWRLLSFELRGQVRLDKKDIGEMANAWPGLKRLRFHSNPRSDRTSFPLSLLADIMDAFPELEDLEASFYYTEPRKDDLLTNLPSACRSSLRKLRLGISSPPESQTHRDLVAEFLARALPPGLRMESHCHPVPLGDCLMLPERQWVVASKENFGPEWDAVLRRIEELHGGVRLRVGSIPEENDGVWF